MGLKAIMMGERLFLLKPRGIAWPKVWKVATNGEGLRAQAQIFYVA